MKKILLAIAVLLGMHQAAYATDARIQALGGGERLWTVHDEANVLYLPATLLLFPNTVWMDAGIAPAYARADTQADGFDNTNVGFGVHYGLGENTVLAFYGSSLSRYVSADVLDRPFNEWPDAMKDIANIEEEGDTQAIHNADHKGTFVLGQRLGKESRLGLLLAVWGDSYEVKEPETGQVEKGGTWLEGKAGLGFDLPHQNSVDLALGFHLGWFADDRYQDGDMVTRLKGDNDWGVDLLARAVLDVPGGNKLVPYLSAGTGGAGVRWNQDVKEPPEATSSYRYSAAGADLALQPLEDVRIWPGAGIMFASYNLEDTGETINDDSILVLPFFGAAVEAGLNSWLSLRFAARQSVLFESYASETAEVAASDVATRFTVGAGMKFGGLYVDLMLNPELFTQGPNVISGKNLDDGFATQAALKMVW